jgi:hypothetical protein
MRSTCSLCLCVCVCILSTVEKLDRYARNLVERSSAGGHRPRTFSFPVVGNENMADL